MGSVENGITYYKGLLVSLVGGRKCDYLPKWAIYKASGYEKTGKYLLNMFLLIRSRYSRKTVTY